MCALFRNKYRIGSKRCRGYDYSNSGNYFVTICTGNRIPYFGKIENGEMILSELGFCLKNEWIKTPSLRPEMNISLDEFIIMPDHFHAIINIGNNRYNNMPYNCTHAMHGVSDKNDKFNFRNEFMPQSNNLSSIMRGVKSAVTIYARKHNIDFQWQPRFHDHIIRTNSELFRIRKYIIENPKKWIGDF
jgi:REP element-mobilizing transposase RayT